METVTKDIIMRHQEIKQKHWVSPVTYGRLQSSVGSPGQPDNRGMLASRCLEKSTVREMGELGQNFHSLYHSA